MSDVDILAINNKIQDAFKTEEKNLDKYLSQLSDVNELLETNNSPKLSSSKMELEQRINRIKSQDDYNFYITESAELIDRYKRILQTPVKLSFMGTKTENNKEKDEIISQYLSIAKKYTTDIPEYTQPKKRMCETCKTDANLECIESDTYVCTECGLQTDILTFNLSYKDVDRSNKSQKYTYKQRVHFRDCINQYQGKQNSNIKAVCEDLEKQYEKHGLLIGDSKTPKEIRFSKITKNHILLFLKDLKHDKHYENINLIYSQQTGIKCDDISHLEDKLMSDFDMLIDLYNLRFKVEKKIDRKNFINTQYVLYQLLNKHKHPCKKEDFYILTTVDRQAFYDDICKQLFEELEWNHTPYF